MNHWVGIVSLRDTAAPTPVHRIALAIKAAGKRTSYQLGTRTVSYAGMRSALRTLGQEHARRSEWDRYTYCVDLAGDFFNGGEPPRRLPAWLTAELRDVLNRADATSRKPSRRKTKADAPQKTPPTRGPRRTDYDRPRTSHRENGASSGPARTPPHRAGRPTSPESALPYVRVARPTALRDITYPAAGMPPAALVMESGEMVRSAIRAAAGEWEAGVEARAWLGLAACHRSYLYENVLAATTVSAQVLGMLDRLGHSTLAVVLLDAYTAANQPDKVGTQSSAHHRRQTSARQALGQWVTRHGLVRMSAGEAQRPAPSVAESAAQQILGALSLIGHHDVARRLVASTCSGLDQIVDDTGVVDPVTEAQAVYGQSGLTYDYTEEGPDHSKTFLATARTRSGRTAHGTGPSKKAARAAAARALLQAHRRAAETTRPPSVTAASPRHTGPGTSARPYRAAPPGHRDAVADLAAMFELAGDRSRGLLAQALTHSSFVYENRAATLTAYQRDNQILANHGAAVLDHLATHTRVHRVLAQGLLPDDDEARIHSTSNEDTARLGRDLVLADGMLTGRGENAQRPTVIADAAQAVIAVAWRVHGPRLLYRRPAVLDDWLLGLEYQHDAVTVLNNMASTYGMTYEFEHLRTGEDHRQTHTATLVLRDAHGRLQRWAAKPAGPCSKTEADRATAEDVLDILAAPADDRIDALTEDERRLLAYLLHAQLDGLGTTSERQRARMLSNGDLGTDLLATGDLDAFLAWAVRVDTLLDSQNTTVPDSLPELYREVLADTRFGPRSLLRRMAADQGTDTASVVRRHAADAVQRAAQTGPWAVAVRDLVQDWWREQAPRTGVTVRDDMCQETFLPLPAHLGALHETLTWCGDAAEAARTRIDVELTIREGTLHAWVGLDKVDVQAACDDFARLLSHTLPHTDCVVAEDHVLLRLHGRPDSEGLPPIVQAGLDAYLSGTEAARPAAASLSRTTPENGAER